MKRLVRQRCVLIDGNSVLYGAYYGTPPLQSNYDSQPVNAVYTTLRTILRHVGIFDDSQQCWAAVCWDLPEPTFRHLLLPEYKAQRSETPEDLISQFSLIKEGVASLGIPQFERSGFEADDIIATIAHSITSRSRTKSRIKIVGQKEHDDVDGGSTGSTGNTDVVVVSADKDLLQLVCPEGLCELVHPFTGRVRDYDHVVQEWGVVPDQLPALFALVGDVADNVRGVSGIGKKIGSRLITDYGSLAGIASAARNNDTNTRSGNARGLNLVRHFLQEYDDMGGVGGAERGAGGGGGGEGERGLMEESSKGRNNEGETAAEDRLNLLERMHRMETNMEGVLVNKNDDNSSSSSQESLLNSSLLVVPNHQNMLNFLHKHGFESIIAEVEKKIDAPPPPLPPPPHEQHEKSGKMQDSMSLPFIPHNNLNFDSSNTTTKKEEKMLRASIIADDDQGDLMETVESDINESQWTAHDEKEEMEMMYLLGSDLGEKQAATQAATQETTLTEDLEVDAATLGALNRALATQAHSSWYDKWRKTSSTRTTSQLTHIEKNLKKDIDLGHVIHPQLSQIFSFLGSTPLDTVKVVIIGQDPYHGQGQADGHAFSVPSPPSSGGDGGVKLPPSLKNILEESGNSSFHAILQDGSEEKDEKRTLLHKWTQQGVLLMNTSLTTRTNEPNSHRDVGWEMFTEWLLQTICTERRDKGVIFLAWGQHAHRLVEETLEREEREEKEVVHGSDGERRSGDVSDNFFIIKTSHPSPFSARRATKMTDSFIGSDCFDKTNQILEHLKLQKIDWKL